MSAVKCNGHLTSFFDVKRSVRQGCPLSAMLYVLSAEPMAVHLINNNKIHGIPVPASNKISLLYQHADDTTLTISSKSSITETFKVMKTYGRISGSKVNVEKSEILTIGATKEGLPNITVLEEVIKILGVYIGINHESVDQLNWKDTIIKMRSITNNWRRRNLTLLGRSTVITSLLTSRVWYTMMVQSIPEWAIKAIKELCLDFLWKNGKHLVGYQTIILKKDRGGLGIPDILLKKHAFRLKSVMKYLKDKNDSIWKAFMTYHLSQYQSLNLNEEIFYVQPNRKEIMEMSNYYKDIMIAFSEIYSHVVIDPVTKKDIQKQPLFDNHNFDLEIPPKIKFYFQSTKIVTIEDIIYDVIPGFFPTQAIVDIVHEKYPEVPDEAIDEYYEKILQAIPQNWSQCVNDADFMESNDNCISIEIGENFQNITQCKTKDFYTVLVNICSKPPVSKNFWESHIECHNHDLIWKNLFYKYKLSRWIEVDFKIAHNAIFSKDRLYRYGLSETNLCPNCNRKEEDILHILVKCTANRKFLQYIRDIIHNLLYSMKTDTFNNLDFTSILIFGVRDKIVNVNTHFINLILSCARYTIYTRRNLKIFQDKYIDPTKIFKNMIRNFVMECRMYMENNGEIQLFNSIFVENNEYIERQNNELIIKI